MNGKCQEIQGITASIIKSYGEHSFDGTLNPDHLPEKNEVISVTGILRRILFPGYFNETGANDLEHHICSLVTEAEGILHTQICRALNLNKDADKIYKDRDEQARKLCYEFLSKLPKVRGILLTDIQAAFDCDPAAQNKHEIIFAYPGITAISIYRLAHELYMLNIPLIPRIMTEHAHSLTGIDIHPGARIGKHFFIDHGTGIVIGETTEIGDYVKLYQGVTLGALSTHGGQNLRGTKRHPTIEDNVTVYSGASILGGTTVLGKGCVIGGGVFLTESVPACTKVSTSKTELDYKVP